MLDGEEKIIELAIRGESSAFGLLYDHYQPKIYRFVLIKVGHREEAEDLTHQVFLSAFQNVARYTPLGFPFSSWLYRIARNQIIDYYRTRKARTEIPLEDVDPEIFVGMAHAEREAEKTFLMEHVRKAIGSMRPDYQDVIIMRFVEELSLKETAAAIGKSEGATKLIQHRAIKDLRKILSA